MLKSLNGTELAKGVDDALNEELKINLIEEGGVDLIVQTLKSKVPKKSGEFDDEGVAEMSSRDENFEWPDNPVPLQPRSPLPDFEIDMLPDCLNGYVEENSKSLQVPMGYIATSLIGSFSTIIGSAIRHKPMPNKSWNICPNLWFVIVGKPSLKKSPAMRAGMLPLNLISKIEAEKYAEEMKTWEPKHKKLLAMQQGVLDAVRAKCKK